MSCKAVPGKKDVPRMKVEFVDAVVSGLPAVTHPHVKASALCCHANIMLL